MNELSKCLADIVHTYNNALIKESKIIGALGYRVAKCMILFRSEDIVKLTRFVSDNLEIIHKMFPNRIQLTNEFINNQDVNDQVVSTAEIFVTEFAIDLGYYT